MDVPVEVPSASRQPARCGRSAELAFWQAHAGQYLTLDLPQETGRCEACGLEDADLIRQPGQLPACAASYSLTRTYPKSGKAARNDQCAGPTLAVVAPGRALIVADGIELPGTGPGLFQVTGRKVDEFLADIIVRPPRPPSLIVSFGKIPAIGTRLRLNLDPRRLFVSGARQLDIDLDRLHLAEMAVAKVDIRELTRAMSVDHARRHGVLVTEKDLAFLDAFRAKWPAADPSRLPDKGTDTAAALLMSLRRLEATTNKFNLVGVTSLDGERLINTRDAADLLGVAEATLTTWRSRRSDGPPYVELCGRTIRYRIRNLLEWAASHERTHTHDPEPPADQEEQEESDDSEDP